MSGCGEGFDDLSANHVQNGRFGAQRVERASTGSAPAATGGGIVGGGADVAWRAVHEGRRCSSEGCRCRRGELHGPYTYLAVYTGGRSRTIYVPAAVQPAAAAHVKLTQRNEALLAEISQINLELLRRRALE